MRDSSFNGGPRKTTSSSKLQSGDGNNKDGKSAFLCPCHMFTNDFMGTMYTSHQQWWQVAQRLQWSFARGNIMGHGQQQNREQRNSGLYVEAISTRTHSSAVMGAFNCPCIYHLSCWVSWCAGLVCNVTPLACSSPAMKGSLLMQSEIHTFSLCVVSSSCIDCLYLTQAHPHNVMHSTNNIKSVQFPYGFYYRHLGSRPVEIIWE